MDYYFFLQQPTKGGKSHSSFCYYKKATATYSFSFTHYHINAIVSVYNQKEANQTLENERKKEKQFKHHNERCIVE